MDIQHHNETEGATPPIPAADIPSSTPRKSVLVAVVVIFIVCPLLLVLARVLVAAFARPQYITICDICFTFRARLSIHWSFLFRWASRLASLHSLARRLSFWRTATIARDCISTYDSCPRQQHVALITMKVRPILFVVMGFIPLALGISYMQPTAAVSPVRIHPIYTTFGRPYGAVSPAFPAFGRNFRMVHTIICSALPVGCQRGREGSWGEVEQFRNCVANRGRIEGRVSRGEGGWGGLLVWRRRVGCRRSHWSGGIQGLIVGGTNLM